MSGDRRHPRWKWARHGDDRGDEPAAGGWRRPLDRQIGRAIETAADRYGYYELTGEGAYAGLHALLRGTPGMDADGPWDEDYEGLILEGELPRSPTQPSNLIAPPFCLWSVRGP